MEEIEKFFKCPYCFEKISMLLDVSTDGDQVYVEDCEVCCNPIEVRYSAQDGKLRGFHHDKAYG